MVVLFAVGCMLACLLVGLLANRNYVTQVPEHVVDALLPLACLLLT